MGRQPGKRHRFLEAGPFNFQQSAFSRQHSVREVRRSDRDGILASNLTLKPPTADRDLVSECWLLNAER